MLISRTDPRRKDSEHFALTLRSIGDAVMTADLDANVTFINPLAELLTGWNADEAIGHKSWEVLRLTDEHSRAPVECPVKRVLREQASTGYTNHTVVQGRDGTTRVISYNASPLRDEQGDLIGVVAVFHTAASREAMRKSEERFQLIARATNDAVWDLDLLTGQLWCNDAVTTLFGYSAQDVDGSLEWWLGRVHPDDAPTVRRRLEDAKAQSRYWQQEYRMACKDGTYSFILERGYVLRDQDDRPVRMVGAVMDVTGRREAQEELLRLNAELEMQVEERTAELRAANRELESFSYSVSHDLRSPLRGIIAASKMLEEDNADKLDAESKLTLGRLVQSAERMSELVEDLLEYSRLSRARLRIERFNLSELAASVAEDLGTKATCRAEIHIEPDMEVEADPALVRILLQNLVENGCKFSRQVKRPEIRIGSEQRRDETVFFVQDNGVGFDMRYSSRLFQPFERLHPEAEYPGSGIGLSNVQRIVKRHGGRVWAESEPGKGATFYFTLA